VRLIKLTITILFLLSAIFVAGIYKYGQGVLNQLWEYPSGAIFYFVGLFIFCWEYVSIISFMYKFEETSDEIEWRAPDARSDYIVPTELKLHIYPIFALMFLFFV
jgi:hypothetical protein